MFWKNTGFCYYFDQQIILQLKSLLDLVDQKLIIDQYGETENELVTLDTGEYSKFVKEHIENCTTPISDFIPKQNLYTFLRPSEVEFDKGADKLALCKVLTAVVM